MSTIGFRYRMSTLKAREDFDGTGTGHSRKDVCRLILLVSPELASLQRRLAASSAAFIPFCASLRTLPRMIEPVKPSNPSDRLWLTLANQNPLPRAGSDTSTRSSMAVQK